MKREQAPNDLARLRAYFRHHWAFVQLHWNLRKIHRLMRSVDTPSQVQFESMRNLLHATKAVGYAWPTVWPTGWFEALSQSNSMLAQSVAFTSETKHYTQEFVHAQVMHALEKGQLPTLEFFQDRLDATALPNQWWDLLAKVEPLIQLRMLTTLSNLELLQDPLRQRVLGIVQTLEPHVWMYDYAPKYASLSNAWCIAPKASWWDALYTHDLHSPPDPLWSSTHKYDEEEVTQVFQIMGKRAYSRAHLEANRYQLLMRDPWYTVRSAFFGDTSHWDLDQYDNDALQMLTDAHAIVSQYHPQLLSTDNMTKTATLIRGRTPRVGIALLLTLPDARAAHQQLSHWLQEHDGQLEPIRPVESFEVDGLL